MTATALVRSDGTIRSVLTDGVQASYTFAYPYREWSPRRWHFAVFVTRTGDDGEVFGIGLVDPGRRITDFERRIEIDEFSPVDPRCPSLPSVDGLVRDHSFSTPGEPSQKFKGIVSGLLSLRSGRA